MSAFAFDREILLQLVSVAAIVLQIALAVGVVLRVIFTRHPPGSAIAWILLVSALPYAGFVLYLFLGERPIGRWRAYRLKGMLTAWQARTKVARSSVRLPSAQRHRGLVRLAQKLGRMPMTTRSNLTLYADSESALQSMLEDVEQARRSIAMEFYIWCVGGWCDRMMQALMRAAQRGVECRVLVDAVGSRQFLKSSWPRRMREAGVHVATALPVSLFPLSKGRADLRLHRKTVVIDDETAYTGSLNMIDPQLFHQDQKLGEWVDAMVRVRGSAVADLQQVIAFDWALQPDDTGRLPAFDPAPEVAPEGNARVVVLASGPNTEDDANRRVILEAINCARSRILLTTPYFIPDESVATALENAALRGVDVRLCLPKHCDSKLTTWAGRRYFSDLMDAGVKILWFTDGVLHTKAITVDDDFALFGTVNLDNRSLHLNFEMMLLVFDRPFVTSLALLQRTYESISEPVAPDEWHARSRTQRFLEGASHLVSPLL
ncbi:MAG: cardiolipin synthase [Duodenibacillus sp.]